MQTYGDLHKIIKQALDDYNSQWDFAVGRSPIGNTTALTNDLIEKIKKNYEKS